MKLLQVTPTYPPDISGVGDYAAILADRVWGSEAELTTLVSARTGPSSEAFRGFEPKAGALASALTGTDRALLHFSGYGYARRGLCRWLVDGLAQWKVRGSDRRLVTMFHEVYATGPVWQSSFWTAGPQRRIARDLARLCDAGFVSSRGGQEQLNQLAPELRVKLLPVFSNVGEPEQPRPLHKRRSRAVVFGGKTRRQKVYAALGKAENNLAPAMELAGVREVVDLGPKMDVPGEVAGCTVTPLGPLPADEVSAVLKDARLGLLDYPGHVFTKSGIAAAYFAHRLPTVNTSSVGGFPPDLHEGLHFMDLARFMGSEFEAQAIADAGHAWYRPHGVQATAEKFLACLA